MIMISKMILDILKFLEQFRHLIFGPTIEINLLWECTMSGEIEVRNQVNVLPHLQELHFSLSSHYFNHQPHIFSLM